MCQEIIDYKESYNNDFSNFFNLKEIDNDAQKILDSFMDNEKYKLSFENQRTPIIEIAKVMGFKIFTAQFNDRNLSGTIGISKKLKTEYGSDKVIILNNQDTDKHILFTLAHEIAHYIYDYNSNIAVEYSNTYRTNEAQTDSELRANRFAAAFLMPAKSFITTFKNITEQTKIKEEIIIKLSDIFNAPETAVKIRIQELELEND